MAGATAGLKIRANTQLCNVLDILSVGLGNDNAQKRFLQRDFCVLLKQSGILYLVTML